MKHAQQLYSHLLRALLAAPMITPIALAACGPDYSPGSEAEADATDEPDMTDSPDVRDSPDVPDTPDIGVDIDESLTCAEARESGTWTEFGFCGDGNWELSLEAARLLGSEACGGSFRSGESECPGRIELGELPEWMQEYDRNQGVVTLFLNGEEGEHCTYYFQLEPCIEEGRLLRVEGDDVTTCEPQEGASSWCQPLREGSLGASLPKAVRNTLGLLWMHGALSEHASIASFARAAMEWMHVQAPPEILHGLQRAGLDEVEHARACFAIAAAFLDHDVSPGPLPLLEVRALDLATLAAETLEDGAISETLAVARAMHMREHAKPESIRIALQAIIEDESRHAALGWQMVRWAVEQGGESVREAVIEAARELQAAPVAVVLPAPDDVAQQMASFGRLDDAKVQAIHRETWAACIEPMLRHVLS